MSDVTEGLGGAIEGALTGRAVEPKRGEAATSDRQPEACANCGNAGATAFCPDCGQRRHVHRSLAAIGHDLIHGVLHLDGKFWNTLPLLLFKPGKLTRRYIDGERAKFVSPMAMFLFTVFAMFAVFQMVGLSVPSDLNERIDARGAAKEVREQAEATSERLQAEIDELPEGDPKRVEREEQLAVINSGVEGLDQVETMPLNENSQMTFNVTGIDWIDEGIIRKWRQNPGLMLYKLQANGYKFSWLLIPLSIPFVWLLFAWKRRFKAYDHAIFVTYSLSFMSLLFIAISLVAVGPGWLEWALPLLVLMAPLHLYKHIRYTYDLSRLSTIWRFLALQIFIIIVIVLFLQALFVIGAF